MRVWASLARAYPSSGVVVRVDSPHTWGAGTVCEPGNVGPIVEALRDDGFVVMNSVCKE